MPFPVPGVAENTERQLRDIANALPGETIDTGADSRLPHSGKCRIRRG